MKIRRFIALTGFSIALVLMFGWLYLSFFPRFAQPDAQHYEFWAPEGTVVMVDRGLLINKTPAFKTQANPNKEMFDAVIVGGLFLIAVVSSGMLLASTRPPKAVTRERSTDSGSA